MCVGIPMRVVSSDGLSAVCVAGERTETVDLALVGPQPDGEWLLVFLGTARERLDPRDAELISRALEGLAAVMAGGDLGDAFADLEARPPSLPPHLEAARRRGEPVA